MTTPDPTLAARLAEAFHSAYERLAPSFGYETREDTKTFSPDSQNGKLMIATCTDILSSKQLITTAEADARVEAAVVAERERQKAAEWEDSDNVTLAHMLGVDAAQLAVDFCQIGLFPCVGVDEGGEYALGPFTDSAGNNIAGCASVYFSEDKRYEWSAYMEIGDAIIKGHWPIGTMPDEIAVALRARGVTG